jgi:hypothetical protein
MAIEQVQGSSGSLRAAQDGDAGIGVMTVCAEKMLFAAVHESGCDAVDGSSTGT